ncbi:MAG: hypothetical protein Q8M83_02235 [bacterium]|nr:hypothetical protein [bacterium]
MRVSFRMASVEEETGRVLGVIQKLEVYSKNNYKPRLPPLSAVSLKKLKRDPNDKGLMNQLRLTIKEERKKASGLYQCHIDKIKKDWHKAEAKFFKRAKRIVKINPQKKYFTRCTFYGVGGNYKPPTAIILNIVSLFVSYRTVAHEILHLLIEPFIEKYKIPHWYKERLVDLYLNKILDSQRWQNIDKTITKATDKVFNKFYQKGAEIIIKELAGRI